MKKIAILLFYFSLFIHFLTQVCSQCVYAKHKGDLAKEKARLAPLVGKK